MNHFNFFITSDFADQISDQSFQQDKLTSVVHVANPCIRAINWVLNQQKCQEKCVQIVVSLQSVHWENSSHRKYYQRTGNFWYNFMCEFMTV